MSRKKKVMSLITGVVIGIICSRFTSFNSDPQDFCEDVKVKNRFVDPMELIGQNTEESLLFIGVMTAARYLDTRAKAVYETWGRSVPGKIAFFSSEHSYLEGLPVVPLIGVDDSYPPQKKSFTMLKYMHDNYLNRFEWFMRADDDVYVRTDKLETLLRSVDSRKPWFIGQTGRGNSEEFGLLSLESDENFCMGGPGIILSRETLRKIGPHIQECLENLYTVHEDVELGRCVRKIAGVSCTWSYEMQVILYHNQSGTASFTGDLKQKEVHRAITLHPIKKPEYMYRLHKYVEGLRIQSDKQESIKLHRDVAASMYELGVKLGDLERTSLVNGVPLFQEGIGAPLYLGEPKVLGISNGLNRFQAGDLNDLLTWEFIAKSWYSYKDLNPKRRLGSATKEGLSDVIREVMEIINQYSKQRGRIIDFKEIFYGYWRLDPLHGVDLILDLLLVYKKYRGHKMTVPVRRHAYIQQTFTGIEVREIVEMEENTNENQKNILREVFSKIGQQIPVIFNSNNENNKKRINFILPLSGRFETFQRFLTMYEEECVVEEENTRLLIIIYNNPETFEDYTRSINLIQEVMSRNKNADIQTRVMNESFSRGKALQHGVNFSENTDLLFFIDVDIVFNKNSLTRIRQNTIKNKQIYFPIVYSLYNPALLNTTPAYTNANYSTFTDENIEGLFGAWRQFGFGIVSLYKSDYNNLGGINMTISGWGFEDVAFYDSAVRSDLRVVRAVDPGLVHVFHPVVCDQNLDVKQMVMCKGSQASTFGSLEFLQKYYEKHKKDYS